ncbi:reverse transcriptase domain-containing protein [uncultured Nostoc sp.]|uniref:RNA-directed DNA polymerase n=1 Tax=uncultured Nostoc sp. TaxID=340711 RepID=UPI0035CA7E3D
MNNATPQHRSLHPLVEDAYSAVHQWLENVSYANGYRSIDPRGKWQKILQAEDLKHIAFQYYYLFPSHYAKAAHILENVVGQDRLLSWLKHRQRICILDIGCGAGAGTAAVIEAALILKEKGEISNDINIFAIGVDPNKFSVLLYKKLLEKLQTAAISSINLDFTCVKGGFPEATLSIIQNLKNELTLFQVPCISNILAIQLNVISPLSQLFRNQKDEYNDLLELDPEIGNFLTESPEKFGTSEAQAYRQIVEDVPVDVMHLLTIATKNMEKHVQTGTESEVTLEERIKEMAFALNEIIGKRHTIEQVRYGNYEVYLKNPQNSYWKDRNRDITQEPVSFYADFQTIWSADAAEDQDWNDVISLKNLKLAWARSRNNLLRESLYDETELRLFEINLEIRLLELQQQLYAYNNDVALVDQRISYKFPKNISVTRPRGLSRIEEEILSVALIQKLGNKASQLRGSSYAYRISKDDRSKDTEYLYEYYFEAYSSYINEAQDGARKYINGAVLRFDIESFYTKVLQEELCEFLSRELTTSDRIRWLIRLLLSKELDEHEVGRGITQGSIGSGFYANIYLQPIDERFGTSNEWGVKFYRYVDDMIFVLPHPDDMDEVEKTLKTELEKLGLSLNDKKTQRDKVSVFLEQVEKDNYLDQLHERFEGATNPLWILNSNHRSLLESSYNNDDRWWHNIERYQRCLRAIGIYLTTTELSRKIYKYLFNQKRRDRELAKYKKFFEYARELNFTQPPDSDEDDAIIQWGGYFLTSNNQWNESINELRGELVHLFLDSWQKLRKLGNGNPGELRKFERYIRFSLTKLSLLGFDGIIQALMEVLDESFWIIRNPINVVDNLAQQDYHAEIRSLLKLYQYFDQPVEYLKAITIRAMRFLPNLDAQEWNLIVKFATILDYSVSIAERLMATETWLYLGYKYNDFKQSHHIDAVKKALQSEPPSRLKKNYLLLLGQFEPNAVQEFSINVNDPMLVDARNIALQGNPSDIFDLPELKILRENYYSGQGPTDSEEGSP